MKQHIYLCMLNVAFLLIFSTKIVEASLQCYGCHGTSIPVDYRPVDASFRNISSGGFPGNHRTHMDSSASSTACYICHSGSNSYTASHRDGMIKVSARTNNSSPTTPYNNTTSAFPQTATPSLGSCAGVNCHFEAITPTWGSDPALTTCSTCHGAPPGDGSHPRHASYYGIPGATASCVICHSDHATDPRPFAHATSAGNRGLVVSFAASPNNGSGSYSGNTNYPNYLPSSTPTRNGSCTNTYCHSPGNKSSSFDPPNNTAAWGGSLSCNGCHKDDAADPMVSGSHPIHLLKGFDCAVCHADTVSSNTTIKDSSKHVNGSINVVFSAPNADMVWNSTLKTCTGTCHSDGRGGAPLYIPTWGGANTHGCGFCHAMPPASGAHLKHMPSPANYSLLHQSYSSAGMWSTADDYAFGCANCHPKDATYHVNGSVDLSLDNTEGGPIKGKNRISTPNSGYTQTKWVSVICSAAYCHGGYTFIYNYTFYDDPRTAIITNQIQSSPDWYGGSYTGDRCAMCHVNPPPTGNVWHSGNHGNQGPTGARNQCQLCHYDEATSTNGYGTAVTNKLLHLNGVLDVNRSGSGCSGCH